ncbi:MAG: DUF4424 domain-containing protein [Bauldia sp.]
MKRSGWSAALLVAVGSACLASGGPASANDATAQIGAGGLELVYNPAIELRSEDLYVSAEEVRVRYQFRNITAEPVTVTVAFPLPALDAGEVGDLLMVAMPRPGDPNFVGFELTVDGKPLTPEVYTRVSALGIDRTQMLVDAGVPLNPADEATYNALGALPAETIEAFRKAGLLLVEDWGLLPVWRLETAFHWEQTFPAGRDVIIEHRYAPVVGYGFFGDYTLEDPEYRERYCMDADFERAARALLARNAEAFPNLNERRIQYILTTARNWASPIQQFRLTVDKGSPDALVSFCGNGVTRTGDTTFEDTETDFVPERELDILIISPVTP